MNKRIVIAKADGSVTVRVPCPADRRPGESDDDFLKRCMAAPVHHGEAVSMAVVDASALPPRDAYRNAWALSAGKVGFDMPRAKEIHRNLIREARGSLMSFADVAVSQALAKGDAKAAKDAEAERQRLRDATAHPSIDAAKTIDELKKAWPL